MKTGKWIAEIYVELEGVSYTFEELQPSARWRIFRAVGRGVRRGRLTEQDFTQRGGGGDSGRF